MYTSNAVHRGFLSKVVTEYALAGTEFFTVLQNSVVCKTHAGGKYNTSRHIMTRLSVFLLFSVYALFFFSFFLWPSKVCLQHQVLLNLLTLTRAELI